MRKKIFINEQGYLPNYSKTAVCHTANNTFSVIEEDTERIAFSGKLSDSFHDPVSGDEIKIADFSKLNETGRFYIKCGYRSSSSFLIDKNVYSPLKEKFLLGIYLNRCGFDFNKNIVPFKENIGEDYLHNACHTELTPMYLGEGLFDMSGGWHDGGYGKYVTVTAVTCACLLESVLIYQSTLGELFNIALDESRWGLEWLLKMQDNDGGVFHKVDTIQRSGQPVLPCDDTEEFFVFPKSYDAALYFTAVCALGARIFVKYDPLFSRRLAKAASNGWIWIVNQTKHEQWKMPAGTYHSGLGDMEDLAGKDVYMWVLAEMYALTGEELFAQKFESLIFTEQTAGFTFENMGGFASLAYLTCKEKINPGVEFFIKKKFGDKADRIIFSSLDGYGVALGDRKSSGNFNCLSNMTVISDCIVCQMAYFIFGLDRYKSYSVRILGYIFGRNPMGISYVTGLPNSPACPAHTLSSASRHSPVPGMVVSGANYDKDDDYSKWRLAKKTPPAKCYIDSECSFSTNSPSVSFGALAFLAIVFYDADNISGSDIDFKC